MALQSLVEGMVLEVHISGHDVSSDKVADDPAATCCQLQIPLVELYSQFGSQVGDAYMFASLHHHHVYSYRHQCL